MPSAHNPLTNLDRAMTHCPHCAKWLRTGRLRQQDGALPMSVLEISDEDLRTIDRALAIAAGAYDEGARTDEFEHDREQSKRDATYCQALAERIGKHLALVIETRMIMGKGPFRYERSAPTPTGGTVELWAEIDGERMAARYLTADGDMIRINIFPTADAAVADPSISWGLPA